MFIDGHFKPGKSRDSIAVVNPATEDIIAEVPQGTGEDAYAALKSAIRPSKNDELFLHLHEHPFYIK